MPTHDLLTGARLETLDQGSGPPLIALHGLAGTAQRHLGGLIAWLTDDNAPSGSSSVEPTEGKPTLVGMTKVGPYRVIGPSLRGYGGSRPKPRAFPPDFYRVDALDVLALMDTLDIERAHLMGYSDGGEVALIAAGLAPERFRSVVVWGASGYFSPRLKERMLTPGYKTGLMPTPTLMALHGIFDAAAFADEYVAAITAMVDAGGDVSLSLAPRITAPLLLMMGTRDHLNFADDAQRIAEAAPHGRLQTFACGHAIQDEAWDDFRRVVGDFLAGLPV